MCHHNVAEVHIRSRLTAHACPMTALQYSMQSNTLRLACALKEQCLELPMHVCQARERLNEGDNSRCACAGFSGKGGARVTWPCQEAG